MPITIQGLNWIVIDLILPFTCMRAADYTLKTETGLFWHDRFLFSQAIFSSSLFFHPHLAAS